MYYQQREAKMRHCPVCGASDKNPQECDSCGYNPVGEFADEMELDWILELDSSRLDIDECLDVASQVRLDYEVICPICKRKTFLNPLSGCPYCGYRDDCGQDLGWFEMDFELALLDEKQGQSDRSLL